MKHFLRIIPVLCLAVASLTAKANTLTFNDAPTGEIGPYTLSLDGTTLNLFCMNDQNFIQGGESWTVNVVNGASFFGSAVGSTGFKYEEEAYIHSQFNGSNAQDIQDALWTIFDPTTSNVDANSPALVAAAASFGGYTTSFLSATTFYIYDGGTITNQYGDYPPQNFAGSSPVPEPSSLFLLGSGLAAAAGMVRRRLTT